MRSVTEPSGVTYEMTLYQVHNPGRKILLRCRRFELSDSGLVVEQRDGARTYYSQEHYRILGGAGGIRRLFLRCCPAVPGCNVEAYRPQEPDRTLGGVYVMRRLVADGY